MTHNITPRCAHVLVMQERMYRKLPLHKCTRCSKMGGTGGGTGGGGTCTVVLDWYMSAHALVDGIQFATV